MLTYVCVTGDVEDAVPYKKTSASGDCMRETPRKPIRQPGYDYSRPGVYFITFCVQERHQILCKIMPGDPPEIVLTQLGQIARKHIRQVPSHYSYIDIKNYIIMPDHIHLIVAVKASPPTSAQGAANAVIPAFISTLKRYINDECGYNLWQRSYNDEIIRSRSEYAAAVRYIENNPAEWLKKYGAYM